MIKTDEEIIEWVKDIHETDSPKKPFCKGCVGDAIEEEHQRLLKEIEERIKINQSEYRKFENKINKNLIEDYTILKRDGELFRWIGEDISEGSLAELEVKILQHLKNKIGG